MPNCKICTLYSGSRGNCAYISAGGANILIDAGKSAKALCSALREIDVDIDSIDAIFITHEHRDHTSALQTLSHKHSIPIYILLPSAEIFYGLKDENAIDKRDPLVLALKSWVDAEYENGRQTMISDNEVDEKIKELTKGQGFTPLL